MIFYRVTYLMKPQHTVVVFDRQKSQISYQKTKYHPTIEICCQTIGPKNEALEQYKGQIHRLGFTLLSCDIK
jgi:hypothetical protein